MSRTGNQNYKKKTIDGIEFDSTAEAKRYTVLKQWQDLGIISDLQMQVKFPLLPAVREPDKVGKRGGIKQGNIIKGLERCEYIADFTYYKDGQYIVEDVKGWKKNNPAYAVFKIKKKLMYHKYGIFVNEV